ncbi:MAG: DUF2948 family protein [Paracoccaceae bacterium]
MTDARFMDATDPPLRLRALDGDDLAVVSGLVQDAVLPASEMRWDRAARRFALLLNRYRWEAREDGERVQAVLSIEDASAVRSAGITRDADTVLSLLSLAFAPGEDGTGTLTLTFAGDGEVAIEVETLEVLLRDVTRAYGAPSGKTPAHPD